jgi:hypothetical protein
MWTSQSWRQWAILRNNALFAACAHNPPMRRLRTIGTEILSAFLLTLFVFLVMLSESCHAASRKLPGVGWDYPITSKYGTCYYTWGENFIFDYRDVCVAGDASCRGDPGSTVREERFAIRSGKPPGQNHKRVLQRILE